VAVKVLIDVGFEPVIDMAQRMGIESPLKPTYSLALGASEVNLLELTGAYGTLAAEGKHTPAHGIRRILSSKPVKFCTRLIPPLSKQLMRRPLRS
jgi:penicillin-binding protein 1A